MCRPSSFLFSDAALRELGGGGAAHWGAVLSSSSWMGVLLVSCTAGPCGASRSPFQHMVECVCSWECGACVTHDAVHSKGRASVVGTLPGLSVESGVVCLQGTYYALTACALMCGLPSAPSVVLQNARKSYNSVVRVLAAATAWHCAAATGGQHQEFMGCLPRVHGLSLAL